MGLRLFAHDAGGRAVLQRLRGEDKRLGRVRAAFQGGASRLSREKGLQQVDATGTLEDGVVLWGSRHPGPATVFEAAPPDAYLCLYCRDLLHQPVLFPCGHSFCRACVNAPGERLSCPECKTEHLREHVQADDTARTPAKERASEAAPTTPERTGPRPGSPDKMMNKSDPVVEAEGRDHAPEAAGAEAAAQGSSELSATSTIAPSRLLLAGWAAPVGGRVDGVWQQPPLLKRSGLVCARCLAAPRGREFCGGKAASARRVLAAVGCRTSCLIAGLANRYEVLLVYL